MSVLSAVNQEALAATAIPSRIAEYDWDALRADINGFGCAVLEKLLAVSEYREMAAL